MCFGELCGSNGVGCQRVGMVSSVHARCYVWHCPLARPRSMRGAMCDSVPSRRASSPVLSAMWEAVSSLATDERSEALRDTKRFLKSSPPTRIGERHHRLAWLCHASRQWDTASHTAETGARKLRRGIAWPTAAARGPLARQDQKLVRVLLVRAGSAWRGVVPDSRARRSGRPCAGCPVRILCPGFATRDLVASHGRFPIQVAH